MNNESFPTERLDFETQSFVGGNWDFLEPWRKTFDPRQVSLIRIDEWLVFT